MEDISAAAPETVSEPPADKIRLLLLVKNLQLCPMQGFKLLAALWDNTKQLGYMIGGYMLDVFQSDCARP